MEFMIISHEHRFIFIKTRKTAGSSLEIALSRFCGPRDVITPISPEDDAARAQLGYPGPQNFRIPWYRYNSAELARWLTRQPFTRPEFHRHMSAGAVKLRVPNRVWNSYFKFAFERSPWDKAISLYYWRTRNSSPRPSLLEYLSHVEAKSLSNFRLYAIDGEVAVDHVARYENLAEEIDHIARRLRLPADFAMPQAKGDTRKDKRGYAEVMGEQERAIVARICEREIALLDYRF